MLVTLMLSSLLFCLKKFHDNNNLIIASNLITNLFKLLINYNVYVV